MTLKSLLSYLLIVFLIFSYSGTVNAAKDNADDQAAKILCNVYGFASGKVGKAIFILIILFTAGSFFLGKANVSIMIIIALSGGAFFGAPAIVKTLTGDKGEICPDTPPVKV